MVVGVSGVWRNSSGQRKQTVMVVGRREEGKERESKRNVDKEEREKGK